MTYGTWDKIISGASFPICLKVSKISPWLEPQSHTGPGGWLLSDLFRDLQVKGAALSRTSPAALLRYAGTGHVGAGPEPGILSGPGHF